MFGRGSLSEAEAKSDKIVDALFGALDSERLTWAHCPDCRRKVRVDYPDFSAQIKAAEMLLEQGYGRPGLVLRTRRPS